MTTNVLTSRWFWYCEWCSRANISSKLSQKQSTLSYEPFAKNATKCVSRCSPFVDTPHNIYIYKKNNSLLGKSGYIPVTSLYVCFKSVFVRLYVDYLSLLNIVLTCWIFIRRWVMIVVFVYLPEKCVWWTNIKYRIGCISAHTLIKEVIRYIHFQRRRAAGNL